MESKNKNQREITDGLNTTMDRLSTPVIQNLVEEFHRNFGFPVGSYFHPSLLSDDFYYRRLKWIEEEIAEARDARAYGKPENEIDAWGDILYFILGAFVEMGINCEQVIKIIHKTNMEKGGGGYAGDGKMLKPKGWIGPEEVIREVFNDIDTINKD